MQRIVVIGTSSGGLDALLHLVPHWNRSFPAPILLAMHIGPHRSHLPELLGERTSLKVGFACDGETLEPGHLYVAPPDEHLLVERGKARLMHGPKEHHTRPAIDPLFRSVALDQGPRAIGVILTGMLYDGSAGLSAIKACGGTTVIQDPRDAYAPSMPRSAMATTEIDHVASTDAIPKLLVRLAAPLAELPSVAPPEWLRAEHAITLGGDGMSELQNIGVPSSYSCPDCGGVLFELRQYLQHRYLCHTGHGFSLRSLLRSQSQVADSSIWASIRALQEKEALLRKLAAVQSEEKPGSEEETIYEADSLAELLQSLRSLSRRVPPALQPASDDS